MEQAPIDPVALDAALRPFGRSRMLPAEAYTGREVFAWEQRRLFAGTWTCLGRTDEVRQEASQRALSVGGIGVLLTFTNEPEGTVRAFANVCRHRGHELLPEGGAAERSAVVCPYHGWAYRLDGTLSTATAMREVASFDPAEHGLVELPAVVWEGWLFVNADGNAPPFAGHLGELGGLLSPYRPAELRLRAAHDYRVAANWKVIVENYQECYHCPQIHPELCRVSPPNSGSNWDLPGAWVGGSMDLREHAETMSVDGHGAGVFIDGAPQRTVRYIAVFPNLLVSAHPDYVMTHRLWPVEPGMTEVECRWYFPEAITDPSYAVDFWDLTNRQDWAACESVQRGVGSPHFRPGPLAPNEDAVYRWTTLIARAYASGRLDPA
ncbi:aromatic ring-hydroxylating oxygenase subunit alpha [Actinoplanes sp. CA-142083]|uniref:aromatic ring-hydroxylating oxygenase subunit alpha n=1 Tax=Actinoplanes sp. CA-142083 TaxID=3239903 RepID=UPI003D8B1E90